MLAEGHPSERIAGYPAPRRLTPVAFFQGGLVDHLPGGQEHGEGHDLQSDGVQEFFRDVLDDIHQLAEGLLLAVVGAEGHAVTLHRRPELWLEAADILGEELGGYLKDTLDHLLWARFGRLSPHLQPLNARQAASGHMGDADF